MDDSAVLDNDKIMRIQVSFDRYSTVMKDLRRKKMDTIIEFRKKIDAVKLVSLEASPGENVRYG